MIIRYLDPWGKGYRVSLTGVRSYTMGFYNRVPSKGC